MKRIKFFRPKLAVALLLSTVVADLPAQQPSRLPTIQLNIGIHLINAAVAATPAQREQGLMFRNKMAPNEGMIFLFEAPAQVCMWMKHTLIPLSVAFIDSDGKIVNIEDMQPETTDPHCSKKPVPYALEMNQGWFRQIYIKPGSIVEGLPH